MPNLSLEKENRSWRTYPAVNTNKNKGKEDYNRRSTESRRLFEDIGESDEDAFEGCCDIEFDHETKHGDDVVRKTLEILTPTKRERNVNENDENSNDDLNPILTNYRGAVEKRRFCKLWSP